MANSEKLESAIRAKLRLKEVVGTDRDKSKDDLNKKLARATKEQRITKTLSLKDFSLDEKSEPNNIVRLNNEPDDKL